MLKHIVFFKFKDDTPDGHLAEFKAKIEALPPVIPEIQSLEFGIDELHTERSWDATLVMTFEDTDALQVYQVHPDHQAVVAFNMPHLANIASVDYTLSI